MSAYLIKKNSQPNFSYLIGGTSCLYSVEIAPQYKSIEYTLKTWIPLRNNVKFVLGVGIFYL
uniref:Putative ovule protein n=1 Tax=Solanum chacoense TaxID=4108 RepID=A0A0V0HG17_SOLCH